MTGMIWQDGQFSWAFVFSVVYLVLLLLGSDYVWRTTRLGGHRLALLAGLLAVLGIVFISWVWS
jgi:hypothetical protein